MRLVLIPNRADRFAPTDDEELKRSELLLLEFKLLVFVVPNIDPLLALENLNDEVLPVFSDPAF